MKGLAYFLMVLLPVVIIGSTVYLTRNWAPTSVGTIVTWLIAWLVSMVLVTILYLLLIYRPKALRNKAAKKAEQNNEKSQH
ncbi:hypothetical protein ACFP1H_09930 [Secundilactobacillus hailunensis]|uniref:DUF3311 domain-containing protein n=1 Tax=Secundilactobacillus hailunensis TaxID=2559923 RepID=A0ABW1T9Y7_9LACO|nr:hypothetical protein [Secundilactobacillus hailunensis]